MCAVTQNTRVCNHMLHPQPLVWGVGCVDEEKSIFQPEHYDYCIYNKPYLDFI